MYFCFISGLHYNLENIYYGFTGAKDKFKAFMCLTPYLTIYTLAYLSSYSQFFEKGACLFFAGLGFYQTYVSAYLNISSTANLNFPYFYIEPYLFIGILILDFNRLVSQ